MKTKYVCSVCRKEYIYDLHHRKGHTRTKCGTCIVNFRRFKLKRKCVNYKGGKCEVCGYNKSLRALVFHHKNPKEKDFGISGHHCRKWETIRKELDKTILLCTNCHAEEHDRIDNIKIDN